MRGACPNFALKPVSLALPNNAIYNLVNRGNTNGDAALGLVLKVLPPRSNAVQILKGSSLRTSPYAGRSVNIILDNRNVPAYLATRRIKGIVTNVCHG